MTRLDSDHRNVLVGVKQDLTDARWDIWVYELVINLLFLTIHFQETAFVFSMIENHGDISLGKTIACRQLNS